MTHRDYFVSASIRIMIFADRIELISPGRLSDVLDTEKIRFGLSNRRNPTLTSHAVHILPYRGLGTGTPRSVDAWPMIQMEDGRQSNQFKVVIQRAVEKGPLSGPSGDQAGTKQGSSREQSAAAQEQAEIRVSLQQEQVTLLYKMTTDHTAPALMTFVGRSNRSKFRE